MAPPATVAANPAQVNANTRAFVLATSVEIKQQIYSSTFDPTSKSVINIPFQNIGLIKYFLVKVTGTLKNAANNAATRTELGLSNILKTIQMTDYQNTVRINTTGWHLNLVTCAKQPLVWGGAYSPNVPENFGVNSTIMSAPSTINTSATAAVSYYYAIPCAYSSTDLTGAIYAGLVNATANLQLTINTTPGANTYAAGGDPTLAIYQSATGAADVTWNTGSSVTITVWQVYLDQLPYSSNGLPILPMQDMNTIYELKNTTLSALVTNQDFNIPYANFRSFLSTSVIFDNGGQLNAGTDIAYWALIAANSQQIFKYGADEAYMFSRGIFAADPPKATYFFDSRSKPINTQNYGNQNLVINPSLVNANAACLVGFEDFAQVQTIQQYGALPNS